MKLSRIAVSLITPSLVALLAASTYALAAPDELLINGGFEDATTGWSAYGGGTLSQIVSPHQSGDFAAAFESASLATKWVYQSASVHGGETYNFSGYILKDDANIASIRLRIRWYAADGGFGQQLSEHSSLPLTSDDDQYQFLQIVDALAPDGAKSARLEIILAPDSDEHAIAYLDDMSFEGPPPSVPTPSISPTATATTTPTPTSTPSPSQTHLPTLTPSPTSIPTGTSTVSQTPTPSPSGTTSGTTAKQGDILINEVQYNPPQTGEDNAFEWIELLNPTAEGIELIGWRIRDNYGSDPIPQLTLAPNGFAIIAATQDLYINFPDVNCTVVLIDDGRIGNGLSNNADRLILEDSANNAIDAVSYGGDDGITSPPLPKVTEGHSIERLPAAGDFVDNPSPSPCRGLTAAESTSTQTASQTITPTCDSTQPSSSTATPSATKTAAAQQPDTGPNSAGSIWSAVIAGEALALCAVAVWVGKRRSSKKRR